MSRTSAVGTFTAWDYLVFALMLLISGLIGIFYAVKAKGQETSMDFLMGNRQMSALPVALSLTASFMSAVTVLGSPFEVYRFGAIFSLFTLSHLFTMLITSEIFLPVFYRLGIASTYEYLELRFNRCVRLCGTILFMIQTILYTGIVIYAPALALNQVTKFHLWGAVISTGIVCTFYCTLGGLKAVIWTDVFQIGIMVAGFIAVIIRAMVLEGGIGNVWDAAYHGGRLNFWNFDPNPMRRHTFWTIVIGGTFVWTGIYGVNQAQVQRYMSCKSRFQAKVSLYMNLIGLWVIMTCAVLSGLSMYSIYRDCDPWTAGKVKAPDQLMPYLVLDIFEGYPGLPGLFVACAYSGTLSTVSSSINALATVTVEDIIKPIFNPLSEKQLSWISKGMTLLYGLLCIGMAGLASLMESLLQSAISIFGIVGGPLVGLFTLGILFSCANSAGGIVGLITGLAFAMWIGIGSQIHPPTPETTMPLLLSVAGCNFSKPINETSWITETSGTTVPGTTINHRFETADTWHSLSYLYISPFASLIVIMIGLIVSLLTGGRKAHVNPNLLLCWTDLSCYFPRNSSGDDIIQVMEWRQRTEPITGNNNAGFSNIEMSCTGNGKM